MQTAKIHLEVGGVVSIAVAKKLHELVCNTDKEAQASRTGAVLDRPPSGLGWSFSVSEMLNCSSESGILELQFDVTAESLHGLLDRLVEIGVGRFVAYVEESSAGRTTTSAVVRSPEHGRSSFATDCWRGEPVVTIKELGRIQSSKARGEAEQIITAMAQKADTRLPLFSISAVVREEDDLPPGVLMPSIQPHDPPPQDRRKPVPAVPAKGAKYAKRPTMTSYDEDDDEADEEDDD